MAGSTAFEQFVGANFPTADRHLKGALKRVWYHVADGAGDDELFERVLEMEKQLTEATETLKNSGELIASQEARIQELEGELNDLKGLKAESEAEDTDTDAPVSHEG